LYATAVRFVGGFGGKIFGVAVTAADALDDLVPAWAVTVNEYVVALVRLLMTQLVAKVLQPRNEMRFGELAAKLNVIDEDWSRTEPESTNVESGEMVTFWVERSMALTAPTSVPPSVAMSPTEISVTSGTVTM
jgi:hypothetical protein